MLVMILDVLGPSADAALVAPRLSTLSLLLHNEAYVGDLSGFLPQVASALQPRLLPPDGVSPLLKLVISGWVLDTQRNEALRSTGLARIIVRAAPIEPDDHNVYGDPGDEDEDELEMDLN